jgi:predicted dehydrogenase
MSDSPAGGRLPVGVVGVGHLGAHHARILHNSASWQLAGVYDIDPERSLDVATQFGLPVCRDLEELLQRVVAVSVCTPTESHFEIARRAVELRRHVFVEKPICASNSEAVSLVEMAKGMGVIGAVGHIERFNPAVNAVRQRLGLARFIEAHRLNQFSLRGLTTDVVLELMIHDIDLARWLIGEEPVEIRAAGVPVLSVTDDIANCRLQFPGGCVANLTASRISTNPMRKIRIFSQNHYTSIDLSQKSVDSYRLFHSDEEASSGEYRTVAEGQGRRVGRLTTPVPMYDALEAELADFHDAIANQRPPRVDLLEGARSLRVALDIAQACREAARGSAARPVPAA